MAVTLNFIPIFFFPLTVLSPEVRLLAHWRSRKEVTVLDWEIAINAPETSLSLSRGNVAFGPGVTSTGKNILLKGMNFISFLFNPCPLILWWTLKYNC